MTKKIINIFCCYAHKDRTLRGELQKHLSALLQSELINIWHDGEILPGNDWKQEISNHLREADIILLLISADFLASHHCYDVEMKLALKRHIRGEAHVIPILLRPVHYEEMPFASLEMLPFKAKPVVKWTSRDEAFTNIAQGVRDVVKNVREAKSLQPPSKKGISTPTPTRSLDNISTPTPFRSPDDVVARPPTRSPDDVVARPPIHGGRALSPGPIHGGKATSSPEEGPMIGGRPPEEGPMIGIEGLGQYGVLESTEPDDVVPLIQNILDINDPVGTKSKKRVQGEMMRRNSQLITILIIIIFGLLSATGGILNNLVSTQIPRTITPYLYFAWPLFGAVMLLGIAFSVWLFLKDRNAENQSRLLLPSPSFQNDEEAVQHLVQFRTHIEANLKEPGEGALIILTGEGQIAQFVKAVPHLDWVIAPKEEKNLKEIDAKILKDRRLARMNKLTGPNPGIINPHSEAIQRHPIDEHFVCGAILKLPQGDYLLWIDPNHQLYPIVVLSQKAVVVDWRKEYP